MGASVPPPSATLTITDSKILGNTAQGGNGGGMCCDELLVMTGSQVNSNIASGYGGGIFNVGGVNIATSEISFNQADQGGGLFISGGSAASSIIQNILTGNSATDGGALYSSSSVGILLLNNTIVDNPSVNPGEAVLAWNDSLAELTNNVIVAAAAGTAVMCMDADAGAPTFTNNNVHVPTGTAYAGDCPDPTGTNGNISEDPVFVGQASGNLHLWYTSPSIDAGSNDPPELPSTDWDGEGRVRDGDGDQIPVVDQGVDEVDWPLFADGFESGDTTAWSAAVP